MQLFGQKQIRLPHSVQQFNQEGIFPLILQPNGYANFIHLQELFSQHSEQIIKQVQKYGAILFRNYDIKNPNEYATIIDKLGLENYEYTFGAAVRYHIIGTPQQKSKSVQVFTTNQAPPDQPIPLHNQLAQVPNYPDYITFFCHKSAEKGGSTPFINTHTLYKYIQSKHPNFLKDLETKKIQYSRTVSEEDNPKSPIGRGWKKALNANTRTEAEARLKDNLYTWEWLQNQTNDLRFTTLKRQGIKTSKSGRTIFFNQIIAVFKGWIDERNQPSKSLKFGDGSEMPTQVLQDIYNYAQKNKISIPWQEGDILLLDNQLVAHSRENFIGQRKIYANILTKKRKAKSSGINLILNNGDYMPILGLGTWKLPKPIAADIVYHSIKAGYRSIDCACDYGNEVQVGQGIKRALNEHIITRDKLFVTSKLWNTYHKKQNVRLGLLKSLKDLGLQYLDLYLIHYPISLKFVPFEQRYPPEWFYDPKALKPRMIQQPVPIIQTWTALQELHKEGLIRSIGVSNFNIGILRDLINSCKIKPSVLQVQIHPYLTQKKLIQFCRLNQVQMTSYSTLGASSYIQLGTSKNQELIINNPVIQKIAHKHKKSIFQVVLRWAIQIGLAVNPKTTKQQRLKQNSDLFDWQLSNEEMKSIDNLNRNRRYNDAGDFTVSAFNTFFPIYE